MSQSPTGARTAETVRVAIVDDHAVLASSLGMVLDAEPDLEAVGTAASLEKARALLATSSPDVVLLDHRLPDGDGVAAIGDLRRVAPEARFVVLTASTADHVLVAAIEAGASGFVSKTRDLGDVTQAVRAAAAGESVISPEMLARLLPRLRATEPQPHDSLTEREREVLTLLAEGLSNAAIADRLVVSVHTVRNHVANLSAKLGAHSKLEALAIAVREGLLPPS
ncbi:response regulator transcription factor [Nocardioides guangzhouensis]|uniref:Response regulator transcription factor n=1 Tax=Nocardioides guangzhouensis TaxID=2497878 RepID=A0A4Q4ZED7_9ACTN|nr:response regulator transcription factor [Nocardioides guangzhouensis]RYP86417.1 response regulator transcription factor [Nocardioides guangzhouensis]